MSIPSHLGKYEIIDILGKGGMGTVYRAHDPSIDRTVALKTIRRELLDGGNGESMVDRFRNEARAAGRLNHPGIVAIYDFGEDQDVAYIAMEYVDGCGLGQFIKHHEARFPIADVVSIMIQLLEALEYVHQRGVIHRDIKAANLLITASGRLKITDFGIARIDASLQCSGESTRRVGVREALVERSQRRRGAAGGNLLAFTRDDFLQDVGGIGHLSLSFCSVHRISPAGDGARPGRVTRVRSFA